MAKNCTMDVRLITGCLMYNRSQMGLLTSVTEVIVKQQ